MESRTTKDSGCITKVGNHSPAPAYIIANELNNSLVVTDNHIWKIKSSP